MEPAEGIFKRLTFVEERLAEYGFAASGGGYSYTVPVMEGEFLLHIRINPGGVSTEVTEADGEPFPLYRVAEAGGAFVGKLRAEAEEILTGIAERCCKREVWRCPQTKDAISYAEGKYGGRAEYLWEKFPDCAILRRADNRKWYAVILTVGKAKLGLKGEGTAEILDLRADPQKIARIPDGSRYFPAYHMNKKNWFTVVLDGRLSMEELCALIDESYLLAKKTKGERL